MAKDDSELERLKALIQKQRSASAQGPDPISELPLSSLGLDGRDAEEPLDRTTGYESPMKGRDAPAQRPDPTSELPLSSLGLGHGDAKEGPLDKTTGYESPMKEGETTRFAPKAAQGGKKRRYQLPEIKKPTFIMIGSLRRPEPKKD